MDREKVIKELQRMADVINQYDDMLSVGNVDSWVILDALALLKKREVKMSVCDKCGLEHPADDRYCPRCGKSNFD